MKKNLRLFLISILLIMVSVMNGFSLAPQEKDKIDKKTQKQAKAKAKDLEKDGYEVSGTALSLEQVILNHLVKVQSGKYKEYESKVEAPTYALGQQKCLGDAQNFISKLVVDSVRFRYDQAYGGDQADKEKQWTDRFFSAFQQVGAKDIGGMLTPSYTIYKKVKRSDLTEYRMMFLYDADLIGNNEPAIKRAIQKSLQQMDEGVEFGKKVKDFIDNGLK